MALPATMLVPSSEPKKDAVGHKAPAIQEFNQIAWEQGLKAALSWRDAKFAQ